MTILILNGSPSGRQANSSTLIKKIQSKMKATKTKVLHLSNQDWSASSKKKIFKDLHEAEGFVFVTGTYWDSWGSPLQIFLENITVLEGGPAFLGKPAMVVVLNHSVGGKGVLSRLQGVLSTFGCLIPPMSGMVYAWGTQQLMQEKRTAAAGEDLWCLEDMEVLIKNLLRASQNRISWEVWPVDRRNFRRHWLKI